MTYSVFGGTLNLTQPILVSFIESSRLQQKSSAEF